MSFKIGRFEVDIWWPGFEVIGRHRYLRIDFQWWKWERLETSRGEVLYYRGPVHFGWLA